MGSHCAVGWHHTITHRHFLFCRDRSTLQPCVSCARLARNRRRNTMNRRSILSISATSVLALALVSSNAVAQLKQQVVGTWTLVSEQTTRPDGSKFSAVGSNAKGILMFDGNGHASLQV